MARQMQKPPSSLLTARGFFVVNLEIPDDISHPSV